MAKKELHPDDALALEQKKQLEADKKQFKADQKNQRKEAKKRAKELAEQEADLDEEAGRGKVSTFLASIVIILLWLAIIGVMIKLDFAGLGSNIMAPIIGDIPILKEILPTDTLQELSQGDSYFGYTSLKDAVDQIKVLELELQKIQSESADKSSEIESLGAEVERLRTFENAQVDFQKIQQEFYEEVLYAENGPGVDEYIKFYESMDKSTAENLYKEAIQESVANDKMKDYVNTYTNMDPKAAAAIFEQMTDNLDLVAKILMSMDYATRSNIIANMSPDFAAKVTKMMYPDS